MFGAAFMRASCALWAAPFNASCVECPLRGDNLNRDETKRIQNRKKLLRKAAGAFFFCHDSDNAAQRRSFILNS